MLEVILAAGLAASSCGCAEAFADVADAVEENYAGFRVKLPDENSQETYRRFRELLQTDAMRTEEPAECRSLIDAYLAFFADETLEIANTVPESVNAPAGGNGTAAVRKAAAPEIPKLKARWTTDKVEFRLRRETDLDPIEGLWRDAEGQLAIVHDAALDRGEYVAFRFRRHYTGGAGEILAFIRPSADGYRIHYKGAGDVWQKTRALLNNETGILTFAGRGWQRTTRPAEQTGKREDPALDSAGQRSPSAGDPLAPVIRELGDDLYYLAVPSFTPRHQAPLRELITEYSAELVEAEGLILDLRGNSGGESIHGVMAEFGIAAAASASEDGAVLASQRNIEYLSERRERLGEAGDYLEPVIERMRANPGEIVSYREPGVKSSLDPKPGPRQVVVLQDRGVGGAAEEFLLQVRPSANVVTMGEPSRGAVDFSQVNWQPVGCGEFQYAFGYPVVMRTQNFPAQALNDSGIAPDVRLAPVLGDWVEYATRWLKRAAPDAE